MAKASLVLDARSALKDGTHPLKISISAGSRTAYVSTGLSLLPSQWDRAKHRISDRHPRWRALRPWAESLLLAAQSALLSNPSASLPELRSLVAAALFPDKAKASRAKEEEKGLLWALRRKAELSKPSTRLVYERALKHVSDFTAGREIPFSQATPGWLAELDARMAQKAPAPNSRAIIFRHIRAAFNWAIGEDACQCYPFRRFKVKAAPTPKRWLPLSEIRSLLCQGDVPRWARRYADFFLLSFFLVGINPKDLLELRPEDLRQGRVCYRRSKTGKLYSVKAEPEALELIGRYRGQEHLLSFIDGGKGYLQFVRQCSRALSRLRPGLTLYWARHSWATAASRLGVPKDDISAALGHSRGLSVTDAYIDFDMARVDAANRLVLDAYAAAGEDK